MEWFENEELALITDTIKTFSAQEITGKVVDLERLGKPEFPRPAIDTLSDLGFLWGTAPEDIGSDMDAITSVVVLSKLAEASAGFAAIVASHYAAVDAILASPGGIETVKRLCACDGDGRAAGTLPLLGVCLEQDVRPRDASGGEYLAIPAPDRVNSTILFAGVSAGAKMIVADGSALAQHCTAKSNLSGCDEMPAMILSLPDAVLDGFEVIASGSGAADARDAMMSSLKLYYSAVMQGAARAATAYSLGYTKERHQTGRAIIYHQNVKKKLVEMEVRNQSMASFLYRAACNGADDWAFTLRDMCYAFVRSESEYVTNEAIQNLGGYGYMREYGLEKKLRDIKTLQALLHTPLCDWLGTRPN